MGVLITETRMVEVRAMNNRVTRSPRKEAIGGAMLSGIGVRKGREEDGSRLAWVAVIATAEDDEGAHEGAEDDAGETGCCHCC